MYKYELNLIEKFKDGKAEGINEGISIGRAEGVSIGEANATNRIVKEMNSNGIPIPVISKCTSVPIEKVEAILES